MLFYGLPGCGKTLLANAFANESGRYFFKFSPADIVSVWIGQSQKNIRDIFAQAKKKSPSLLFIDELDSIGFNCNEDNAHTDQKATINQLLIRTK
ncbi:ATP-binding protein [Nostoc sp.]|uniref:ATP-binding protein n=1 Tax=Nostoc sp. TaxID=1180 RepID=UPI002FFB53EF